MPAAIDSSKKETMPKNFRALPSFRLGLLAATVERHIGLRYQRKFGLKPSEAHIVGAVGSQGPIGFKKMCAEAGLDKSSASRHVARLLEKGLVQKIDDVVDQRAFYLTITVKGKRLYTELLRDAWERDEHWMSALPEEHRASFLAGLDALSAAAREMLRAEDDPAGGRDAQAGEPEWQDAGIASAEDERRLVVLNESAATQLVSLLEKLIQQ